MNYERQIQLDENSFVWAWDTETGRYNWRSAGDNMVVPLHLEIRLNRHFIDTEAHLIVEGISREHRLELMNVLRSMKATDSDLRFVGLEREIALQLALSRLDSLSKSEEERLRQLPAPAHSPFNCPTLANWYFAGLTSGSCPIEQVARIGRGPFEAYEIDRYMREKQIHVIEANCETDVLVLGREGWKEEEVDKVIEERVGKSLRIYSQEMLLCAIGNGKDPFEAKENQLILAAFREGHPGLEFVSEGWPGWVSTYVSPGRGMLSQHSSGQDVSPLKELGYTVGSHGKSLIERQNILRRAFEEPLPNVGPVSYMNEWGEPKSGQRLRKIANALATFCCNAKRRKADMSESVFAWEIDLHWLKDEFYHGHMQFEWPDTMVG